MENSAIELYPYGYRKALPSDIDSLLSLYASVEKPKSTSEYSAEERAEALHLLINSADSVIFLTEYNHDIIAMCSLQTCISARSGGLTGVVNDVLIHARFRGLEIGSHLLEMCESFAHNRGMRSIHFMTDSHNATYPTNPGKNERSQSDPIYLAERPPSL